MTLTSDLESEILAAIFRDPSLLPRDLPPRAFTDERHVLIFAAMLAAPTVTPANVATELHAVGYLSETCVSPVQLFDLSRGGRRIGFESWIAELRRDYRDRGIREACREILELPDSEGFADVAERVWRGRRGVPAAVEGGREP